MMTSESSQELLADGLLKIYEPSLKKLQNQLTELTTKQSLILNEVENENKKFQDILPHETAALFNSVKDYHLRLLNVKREMMVLSERSAKIKKRALKLKELKEKEALQLALNRESQIKREEDLIAKPL